MLGNSLIHPKQKHLVFLRFGMCQKQKVHFQNVWISLFIVENVFCSLGTVRKEISYQFQATLKIDGPEQTPGCILGAPVTYFLFSPSSELAWKVCFSPIETGHNQPVIVGNFCFPCFSRHDARDDITVKNRTLPSCPSSLKSSPQRLALSPHWCHLQAWSPSVPGKAVESYRARVQEI